MLYLIVEKQYRDFPWCQRSLKSLLAESKKKRLPLHEIERMDAIPAEDGEAVVLLLCSSEGWLEQRIAETSARNARPIALYNRGGKPNCICSAVTMNLHGSMQLATNYLYGIGCERLALYAVNSESTSDPARMDSFLDLTRARREDCFMMEHSFADTYRAFSPHLREYDGVICTNDYAAASLLHNLKLSGEGPAPHIIGFGNMDICSFFRPTITSISDDYEHFGAAAMSIYKTITRNEYVTTVEISLGVQLHVRESTGNLPYRAPSHPRVSPREERQNPFFQDYDVERMRKMEILFNRCDEIDREILHHLEHDRSYAAIAEQSYISETAVKYRVKNMEALCGVNSRAELKELLWGVF